MTTAPNAQRGGRVEAGAAEEGPRDENGAGSTMCVDEAHDAEVETDADAIGETLLRAALDTLAEWVHVGPPMTGAELELCYLRSIFQTTSTPRRR